MVGFSEIWRGRDHFFFFNENKKKSSKIKNVFSIYLHSTWSGFLKYGAGGSNFKTTVFV